MELCSSYLQGICNGSCTSLHICKSFLLSGKFCKESCKSGFSDNVRDSHNKTVVRVKLDVELCSLYPQGICDGSCTSLHICKSFLLSGKFCKEPCKSGFSHDIRDSHNKTVLDGYNMDDYGMKLLRSSFPRLCASFQENGKCGKYLCGYLHLCIHYIQGKCQNQCQLAVRFGLSKQETHGLTSPHNVKVLSSFDLLQKKRDVLLGNILYHSGFAVDNEIDILYID